MVGILFAGFLYADGEGFENGTIFYIVTILLFIGAAMMALMSRHTVVKSTIANNLSVEEKEKHEGKLGDKNEKTYTWFLASLIIIVLGAASINQIFLLFIKLPDGLNASDPEMSLILGAWTVGGMIASIVLGRLADKVGRNKVIFLGLIIAAITPLLYGVALTVPLMALIYGLNGVSFWTSQTVGFAIAGDIIPEHKRGRLLSRYNAVMAIGWGPAGFLVGGPLADIQVKILGLSAYTAYLNTFFTSSILVILGTILFAMKVAKRISKIPFKF
jgi:MFS family permease